MRKYVIPIIVITVIILILSGGYYIYSSNNSQDNIENLKVKVSEEIRYLNTTIISMINQLNNITYANYEIVEEKVKVEKSDSQGGSSGGGQSKSGEQSSSGSGGQGGEESQSNTITNINMNDSSILVNTDKKIDWNNIKKETEKMYQTWTTVLIDLNSLNVNQDNLRKYTTTLDNVTKAVQKEDKKQTARELANLYGLIAAYAKDYEADTKAINLLDTKSNILYAYALVEDDNWNEMKNSIKKAQNAYNKILNGGLQNSRNISSINKSYVLLNEIEKSTDTQDKNIFYINYKNLMQELEIMDE